MTDQPGEMPKTAPQSDAQQNETPPQVEGEKFDADRAMALIEKLRNEVKELKPKAKQAEDLAAAQKAKDEAEMTEVQKLNKALTEAQAELKATRRSSLAASIAAKVGLSPVLADRLKGETPEEMEADAKAILEALPKAPEPSTKAKQPGPINPGVNGQQAETRDQKRARLTGTNAASPLEGGGVVWKQPPPN